MRDLEKQRDYQRRWMASRRAKYLAERGPCVQCGSSEKLEVDHIDPKTKVSHRFWSWKTERLLEELNKCQVLCRNCHVKKTIADMGHMKHGTVSLYRKGCRCDACKMKQRDRMRIYMSKKK